SVRPYHAGLADNERRENQESFIRDNTQIIVATIAFGMGINKPNIRFIVHHDLPGNIESYYQQIGRAGRDGLTAHCLLLFSYADIQKIQYFIRQKEPGEQRIASIQLNALVGLVESDQCRRVSLLRYFGEEPVETDCEMCDNCTGEQQALMDVTLMARRFLWCVNKTGQRFGAGHIIDILRGSRSQRITQFGHHELEAYEAGKAFSKKQWHHLSRQFIQKGLLTQDSQYGSLVLTPQGIKVLKKEEQVWAKLAERKDTADTKSQMFSGSTDSALFEILRQKRKMLADETGIPPYAVFPDKTLIEMATFYPQSLDALLQLHGVGSVKLEKYGGLFLDLIRGYCTEHGIEARLKQPIIPDAKRSGSTTKKRYVTIGEEFNSGKSLGQLMGEYNVKRSTVVNHLYKYIKEGNSLRHGNEFSSQSELPADKQQKVLEAFERFGTEQLKPVSDALEGQISYDELHLLRLHYLCGNHGAPTEQKVTVNLSKE
ncbi:MAG: DNA helicase RecQ, partial [Chitinivibrionales bacterium]|nr:DNA helicase RecQ [Chitinivibrionales bacterium]